MFYTVSNMTEVNQMLSTLSDVLSFMAPSLGGAVPNESSDEYADWVRFVNVKYEEASRRAFWRRLLTREDLTLAVDDEEVLLPVRFQRANSLYICYVGGVDLGDPDREPDDQDIFAEMINDPDDANFGRWKLTFSTPIETAEVAPFWYFATPPKLVLPTDKLLLPGDMIAYGAMAEIFRTTNLEGSQDDARTEYENRLANYLATEMIPEKNKLLTFASNPRAINRSIEARNRYRIRPDRVGRSF